MDTEAKAKTNPPGVAQTLHAVLAGGDPAAPAVLAPEDGLVLTYEEMQERVDRLAAMLRGAGIDRGDRVALASGPGVPFLECLFAILRLGAAAAPLNPAYTAAEFRFYLEDIAPRMVLLPEGEMAAAREAVSALPEAVVADVASGPEGVSLAVDGSSVPGGSPFSVAQPDDVALLLHTSGTTSRPKQVPLLHRNLVWTVHSIVQHYALTSEDVSYCLMPLFHVHGLVASTWAALAAGGKVVVPARRSGRGFWAALQDLGVTWYSASPTIHQMMIEQAPATPSIPRLRFIRSCSAALTPALESRLEQMFAVPVAQAYGMTEASHQIASNPLPPGPRVAGSVGVPTGTEIRVIDDEGREVGLGRSGHVLVRGPGITPGYLNAVEANAEAFLDGWFRTGDLGVLDADGYLRLSGRAKELIIRGGENISPYEIEDTLLEHPAVLDAVCFAIPDAKYGEEVGAAVRAGAPVSERELRVFCRGRLAAFKVPKSIYILERIPRTATGKLQRRRMHGLLAQEHGD